MFSYAPPPKYQGIHIYPKPDEPIPDDIKKLRENHIDQFLAGYPDESVIFYDSDGKLLSKKDLKKHLMSFEEKLETMHRKGITSSEWGYVYILKMGDCYKIGYSTKLEKRIEDIVKEYSNKKPELPYRIDIMHYVILENSKKVERELHNRFRSKRLRGEWFKLTENEVTAIINKLLQMS